MLHIRFGYNTELHAESLWDGFHNFGAYCNMVICGSHVLHIQFEFYGLACGSHNILLADESDLN